MIRITPEQLAKQFPGAVLGPSVADGFARLHDTLSTPATEPADEKDFMADVVAKAKQFGYRVYHTLDSRKCAAGFPDLCIAGRGKLIFAELKVGNNQPTAAQLSWLEDIRSSGTPAFCWWPKDWPEIIRTLVEGT